MRNVDVISIIIPIFNKCGYIDRCLESIVNQSYFELEIILVNDGSTDQSDEICKKWVKLDGRIKYYSKKNGGVSSARNYGLKQAQGTMIAFVDPDDYIDSHFFMTLKKILDDEEVDISYCYAFDVDEKTGIKKTSSKETSKVCIIDSNKYNWIDDKRHTVVWGALYRKKILEGVHFDEDLVIGEDTLFFSRCIRKANKVASLDKALYYYSINLESLTAGMYSDAKKSEVVAWWRICDENKDNRQAYTSAMAGYALTCRDMAAKYSRDIDFIKGAQVFYEKEFKKNIKNTVLQLIQNRKYKQGAKVVLEFLFWNKWMAWKKNE